jgi:glycopeptide antibiotics resistance protein
MNTRERISLVFLYVVFIGYLFLLFKILLLSRISIEELFNSHRDMMRSINLIPFHSISEYISGSSANLKKFAYANVVGNVLIFIPLGVYLSLFKRKSKIIMNLMLIFIVSLGVELIQGLLAIGTADVDDIILNVAGGWIGIFVYKFLLFLLRDEKKVQTVITFISAIVGLPVLCYYLFIIKMRF